MNIYPPAPNRNNSILPSPSPKSADFTSPPTHSTLAQPGPIPHTARSSMSNGPSPQLTPTIYPGIVPDALTQPAPRSVQPRKTGFPCLTTILISVVLLLVIGSLLWLPGMFPSLLTVAPTTVPTPTPTTRPTGPVTDNEVKARMASFCFDLAGGDATFTQKAFDQMSARYQTKYGEPAFANMDYAKTSRCSYDYPYLLNGQSVISMHVAAGSYTVTIIYDPKSDYQQTSIDDIHPYP